MKYFLIIIIIIVSLPCLAQRDSVLVFAYSSDDILIHNGEKWILSPYEKAGKKVFTRSILTPSGKYIFRINRKAGVDTLKTSSGKSISIISFSKKTWLNTTIPDGGQYVFKKQDGNTWSFLINNKPVFTGQLKKMNGVRTLEFLFNSELGSDAAALILLSQVYGVDRIAQKKQAGVTWGIMIGLAIMNAAISSSVQ